MNREIKFRAWDIQNKRMIYFNAFEQWGFIDHTKDSTRSSTSCDRLMLSTDPKEFLWMQFTGLLDKNGKEIFENDVVSITRHGDTINHAIVYQSGAWRLEPDGPYPTRYICEFNSSIIEVIGNIHENKELLE